MPRLTVSLTNHPVDPARASLNYLTPRFSDSDRLSSLPDFETLPPAQYAENTVSALLELDIDVDARTITPGRYFEHRDNMADGALNVMHQTCYVGGQLVTLYDDRVEIRDSWDGPVVKAWSYSFMNGSHTVYPRQDGTLLISASAFDVFFVIDPATGTVLMKERLPADIYGENYDMTDEADVRRHYIHNDLQLAHMNSAYPCADGSVLLSTLAQGDIARWHKDTGYRVLCRGYVGAHNARETASGEIYFSDSCAGMLVFLDQSGRQTRRYDFSSIWLHDAVQIEGAVFLGSVADRRKLVLVDAIEGTELCVYDLGEHLDMTPKFLSMPLAGQA